MSNPNGKNATFSRACFSRMGISAFSGRHRVEQADLLQILRRDGQRDGVADGLVKSVICAIHEQIWLVLICTLIKVVPKFVVNGDKIDIAHLDTHLDAKVALVVDVPGTGVADYVAVRRLNQE